MLNLRAKKDSDREKIYENIDNAGWIKIINNENQYFYNVATQYRLPEYWKRYFL